MAHVRTKDATKAKIRAVREKFGVTEDQAIQLMIDAYQQAHGVIEVNGENSGERSGASAEGNGAVLATVPGVQVVSPSVSGDYITREEFEMLNKRVGVTIRTLGYSLYNDAQTELGHKPPKSKREIAQYLVNGLQEAGVDEVTRKAFASFDLDALEDVTDVDAVEYEELEQKALPDG